MRMSSSEAETERRQETKAYKKRYLILRSIQTSVVEKSDVTYKPIDSVQQSDLEFLIPADNDTYVYLNIKLYIRGKLVKANGTNLDNTNFTAVTNNFLHSLFSQCSIALNGVTIRRPRKSITFVRISRRY